MFVNGIRLWIIKNLVKLLLGLIFLGIIDEYIVSVVIENIYFYLKIYFGFVKENGLKYNLREYVLLILKNIY